MNDLYLDKENIPKHVAIIMDGNGRWAKQKGEMRIFGHTNGVESVRASLTAAGEIGVKYLTLYAFSTENWKRSKKEVKSLMELFVDAMKEETPELIKNSVRANFIGDISRLKKSIIDKIAEMLTRKLVIISEKYFVTDLPKYPIIEPSNGKNKIAYSI